MFFEKLVLENDLIFDCSQLQLKQQRLKINFLLKNFSNLKFCSICGSNLTEDFLNFSCLHGFHINCFENANLDKKNDCLICFRNKVN